MLNLETPQKTIIGCISGETQLDDIDKTLKTRVLF